MYLFSLYCLVASNADAETTDAAGRGAQPPLNAFRPRPLCASNYNLILRHNSINKQCGCSLTEQHAFAKVVISFIKRKWKPVDGVCVINYFNNSTIIQKVHFKNFTAYRVSKSKLKAVLFWIGWQRLTVFASAVNFRLIAYRYRLQSKTKAKKSLVTLHYLFRDLLELNNI